MMNVFKDKETFIKYFKYEVERRYAIAFDKSNSYQQFIALGALLKEHISSDWINSKQRTRNASSLLFFDGVFNGRMITNNLMSAGVYNLVSEALKNLI